MIDLIDVSFTELNDTPVSICIINEHNFDFDFVDV